LFFYTEAFQGYDMGPQHPLKPVRLRNTYTLLDSYGLFGTALELAAPTPATRQEVAQTHDPNYLEAIDRLSSGEYLSGAHRFGFGTGDNPVFPGMYEASMLYTGASADAAQAILDNAGGGRVAFNLSGGLHHAHYGRAAGFCVLNDSAVAIRRLRQKYDRVAYVDIDLHHGDGVQELFYDDPTVLTISLHETGETLFPGTGFTYEVGEAAGEGFSVNAPLAPYTPDDLWLMAWREAALPLLKAFDPGAILLQMGTDPHVLDPLGHLCLTAQGWLEAVKDVQTLGKPIVAVGGGGYNQTTVPRMWTLAVSTLAGVSLPDEVPVSYPLQSDIPTLTDHAEVELDAGTRRRAIAYAERTVQEVRALLFSRHGLA
jgi:acetoin utilization protein AcuC